MQYTKLLFNLQKILGYVWQILLLSYGVLTIIDQFSANVISKYFNLDFHFLVAFVSFIFWIILLNIRTKKIIVIKESGTQKLELEWKMATILIFAVVAFYSVFHLLLLVPAITVATGVVLCFSIIIFKIT